MIDMSGYGSAGPRRERKAYDMLVQAETGMISVTGTPETATKTGIPVSDIAAGMYALTSILSACSVESERARERSSRSRCSIPPSSGWAIRCT